MEKLTCKKTSVKNSLYVACSSCLDLSTMADHIDMKSILICKMAATIRIGKI